MGIFTIAILFLLTPVAITFALGGAAACGVIGGARKLNIIRSIVTGFLFGLFVFPLALLVPRLLGRFPPNPVLWLVCFFSCLLWLAFVIGLMVEMSWIWGYRVGGGNYYATVPLTSVVIAIILLIAVMAVSAVTILWSLRGIHRLNREESDPTVRDRFPSFRYLLPSVLSAAWFFGAGLVIAVFVAQFLAGNGVDIQGF